LAEIWCSAIRGLGAIVRSQYPASLVQHCLAGATLIALVLLGDRTKGAILGALAFLCGAIGTLAAAGWLLRRELPGDLPQPAYLRRQWLDVAGSNLLIAACQAVRAPLIVIIAGAHVDSHVIAYYVAAQRLASVTSLALLGISGFAAPLMAQQFALTDVAALDHLARLAARGAFAGALLPALLLVGFGHQLLGLFGAGFHTAYQPLLVLLVGELAAAVVGPVGFLLTMTNQQRWATWIEALSSLVTVAFAVLLVPGYGILGAAMVVAAGSVLRNGLMFVTAWRKLGVRPTIF
jgi:O-antigen/teichoic acid export membrane protein